MDVGTVCDSCTTFNPMGSHECLRCHLPLSLDPETNGAVDPAPSPSAATLCTECGTPLLPSYRFCGGCGHRVDSASATTAEASGAAKPAKTTMFFSAVQASHAKLVLIKGDGLDGVSFTLAGDEHIAGREDAALLFEEDPFLSPRHANFYYKGDELIVRDESSVNGVYLRTRGSRRLEHGDLLLVGEQLLEVQLTTTVPDRAKPSVDGTYFFASPRRASHFRIVQRLRGGDTGLSYRAQSDVVSLGREGNDINFPDDPFISGHHAQIGYTDDNLTLTDLDSKNGTFLRINDEQKLEHGDYVFMGQQLLRVEIV